jgi:hypothetical protein
VQVKCDTPLESSRQELQVCVRPHPNWMSEQKVISLQSGGSPNRDNFGTLPWESRDKKPFGCRCRGEMQRILYGGRWWLPPSPGRGESCESVFARGLSVHQKCSNYALTNLLFGLCRSVGVIDLLVTFPSPYPKVLTCPSTPEVL